MNIFRLFLLTLFLFAGAKNAASQFLRRSIFTATEAKMELSSPSTHYFAMFGEGDDSSSLVKGLTRYGDLTLDPYGKSKTAKYRDEEEVIYVMEGTGTLTCEGSSIPVSSSDFVYIPAGVPFTLSNPRERKLSMFLMGFRIMPGNSVRPSPVMMIANAEEVTFQVLGYHGPSTTFRLLMGTTESTRDKLAAACQVTSLFIMDFAAGGTNIPHRHDDEEEIYFILRGKGDIVAGETTDGKEWRHPSKEGDVYFFSPGTLIGFYSTNGECEEHSRILAVRYRYPVEQK